MKVWKWLKEHMLELTLIIVLVVITVGLFISFCYGRENPPPDHITKSIVLHYADGTVVVFATEQPTEQPTEIVVETEIKEAEPPTEIPTAIPTPEVTPAPTNTPSPTPTEVPTATPCVTPSPTPDQWFYVLATAYCDTVNLKQGRVPTGCMNDIPLREDWSIAGILTDLPYGTLVEIEGLGVRCVEDTASQRVIEYRKAQMQSGAEFDFCETWIDVFMTDPAEVDAFGVRAVKVRIIGG